MGNVHFKYHCCIHDSSFNGETEDVESDREVEKEPFKIIEKTIDKIESFTTDVSPLRKHDKNGAVD